MSDAEAHDSPVSEAFSARLDTLIKEIYPKSQGKPYSHGQIARATGLTSTQIGNLRSGFSQPKLETAARIAAFFGVPVDYFTGDAKRASQIEEEIAIASAMRNAGVRQVALRAGGLSPDALEALGAVIDQFRKQSVREDEEDV